MSLQESRSTSRLLTQRWTKFGMDRLYVKTDDGLDVGWLDLVDGSRLVTKPQFAEAFNLTVESWLASRSQGCTSTLSNALAVDSAHVEETGIVEKPSVPRLTDRAQRAEQPWDDLALRVAGQAATEQADLLWIQGPEFRSFLSRLLRIRTKGIRTEEERMWRLGAEGERLVGRELTQLPSEWRCLHAVPVGDRGSDIDHVVVGPGGVFTLNTKNHRRSKVWVGGRTVLLNGTRVEYIRNSEHEARRAGKLLSQASGLPVSVDPLLVVIARTVTVKEAPQNVSVLTHSSVCAWLSARPRCLGPDVVDAIYEMARRSTTWSG